MRRGIEPFLSDWRAWSDALDQTEAAGLYFYLRRIDGPQGAHVRVGGRDLLMFASNNYLGLANDPRLKRAAIAAIETYGTGSCGTSLVNGFSALHAELEAALCAFKRAEACLLFTTGYQANLGAISALVGDGDVVICDRLDHASIFDGARLSGAQLRLFGHNDMDRLRAILAATGRYHRRLIVVDGVYSMDGDLADLPAICALAEEFDAIVMVDEAHATGVMGEHGRGTIEHFGLEGRVDVVMGTMSKALASVGGYVAGRRELVRYLKHRSRPYIFAASQPPAAVAAARAALEIIACEPERRRRLWENTAQFHEGLRAMGYDISGTVTPIVPILLGGGDPERLMRLVADLERRGLFVCAILPPAVPPDQMRLRAHVSAAHSPADIAGALEILHDVGRRHGVI